MGMCVSVCLYVVFVCRCFVGFCVFVVLVSVVRLPRGWTYSFFERFVVPVVSTFRFASVLPRGSKYL